MSGCSSAPAAPTLAQALADGGGDGLEAGQVDAPDGGVLPRPSRGGLAWLQYRLGHIARLAAEPDRLDLAGVACVLAKSAESAANAPGGSNPPVPPVPPPSCWLISEPRNWETEPFKGGVKHSYSASTGAGGGTYAISKGYISIAPPAIHVRNQQGLNDREGLGHDTIDTGQFSVSDSHIDGVLTVAGEVRMRVFGSGPILERAPSLSRVAVDVAYRFAETNLDDGGVADDAGADAARDPAFCITSGAISIEGVASSFGDDASIRDQPYRVTFTWSDCDVYTCTYSLPNRSDSAEKPCALP